ncbi:peptidylprolyl isomerase PrsA [Bacillus cereus]|uniref:peptidylprolyl isomerase n=1 Tax=Bacillus cereus TaxID=1396 RepID=A0A164QPN6_BACCE|nr:peptidylprolyl isomerase [Bacillus cereus]KZD72003.1 Foldase protein PrsA precursor [Bacillus cereus]HDR8320371.1 peptidylprolyl isomerase [Bacillus cereus]HDR8328470.1 peptidylprolyl isomerase [Bacillus cereus]HDR8334233.1 peptidylprolyl isomerase [Bacillus cereus]
MPFRIRHVAAVAALSFALVGCSTDVLVKTNAGSITKSDLNQRLEEQYGEKMLNQVMLEQILLDKYPVTEKDEDQKLKEIIKKQGMKNEDEFFETLKANGMNKEQFSDNLKVEIAFKQAMMSEVKDVKKKRDSSYELLKEEVKARHILVETKEEADSILKQLKEKPESFEELAKTKSKDTSSAAKGGDLGFFPRGAMDPAFEKVAFELNKNQISEVVQSNFGYHIIQTTDKKETKKEDLRFTIDDQILATEKIDEEALFNKLKKEYKVEVRDSKYKNLNQ